MLISLSKFYYRKEAWGYAKVIHKKRVEKKINTTVSEILKTMGT